MSSAARSVAIIVLSSVLPLVWRADVATQPAPLSPPAAALAEFDARVKAYMALHHKMVRTIGPHHETASPAEISARERAIGDAIRAARADAQPGAVFVAGAATVFRDVIMEEHQRRDPIERKAIVDELPAFAPQVNQTYPSDFPLATFPAKLLKRLPELPPDLEYRFVARHLILRDVPANLIVDFVPDVLP